MELSWRDSEAEEYTYTVTNNEVATNGSETEE